MLIKKDFCLKPFNSFKVEALAKRLSIIGFPADLNDLFTENALKKENILVLGEGSNILFTKTFEGFILLNQIRGITIVKEENDCIYLKINGGENWSALVDYTVDKGWGGIENLSLIPGTVGAAPVQNIGAYGVELRDVLTEVEAFDLQTGETKLFSNKYCGFGYRDSIFKTKEKGRFFILSVTLKLDKNPVPKIEYAPLAIKFEGREAESITVKEISDAVKEIRSSKLPDPQILGNAGSFFKNPVVTFQKIEELIAMYPDMPFYKIDDQNFKIAAGWLIEKAGWKGKRIGDAGVHEKQALVLVNYGKARGKEILDLSMQIQSSIQSIFGIQLDCEVNIK